ncbi:hypothetical protein [Kutzneria kofuensis]|uniref:Uncharacterized protein n=1 Tax=Kutzneria kofuensis TaxID=103725 RepID=A0A7W9NEV1_9PSEU|nr:hypothetical protein [Kutzneria kofuensis]MBB5889343.1 hypothetical protein [Kutzneria kofuensis]
MRQHEDSKNVTTTEDIAAVDEPRAETDPIDSDRTDADRVESERVDTDRASDDRISGDRFSDDERMASGQTDSERIGSERDDDRVVTVDETARPTDTTLAGRHEPGHVAEVPGQRQPGDAAADVLFDEADAARFRDRWREVQAGFVDDPKRAVQDADVLVAELMQSLASAFSERKHLLEDQWREGSSAETEDLRLALRGYRSFLDQLLAH